MEIAIPRVSDGPELSLVKRRLRYRYGMPIGKASDNPIFDTSIYDVEYPDGHNESLAVNVIA